MKPSGPRILLLAEGLAVVAVSCALYAHLKYSWLNFGVLFLAPDLSAVGYLVGKRAGAWAYNSAHTYLSPAAVGAILYAAGRRDLEWISLIWSAHIGFDRILGYGLKYPSAFKDTHLQRV